MASLYRRIVYRAWVLRLKALYGSAWASYVAYTALPGIGREEGNGDK